MTELRRSSRVRQSAKHSPQYYELDEKKRLLSTPDVRPRKWHETQVAAGYFIVKRWVPKDQDHLTKELHGGLTEKGDLAGAGKNQFLMRGAKGGLRTSRRNRAMVTPSPTARGKGIHNSRGARSLASPESSRGGAAAGGASSLGSGAWGSQGSPAQMAAAPASGLPPVPSTAAMPGSYLGTTSGEGPTSAGAKRPLGVGDGGSTENEPSVQSRRLSDEDGSRPDGASGRGQGVDPSGEAPSESGGGKEVEEGSTMGGGVEGWEGGDASGDAQVTWST